MNSGTLGSLGGSSLSVQGAQGSFDVTKESDLIALLKLIHQNPLAPEVKNQLRDLIFGYRQDEGSEVFSELVSLCASFGITVVGGKTLPTIEASSLPISKSAAKVHTGRPLPSFGTPVAPSKVSAPATPEKSATPDAVSVPLRRIVVPRFEPEVPVQPVAAPEPVRPIVQKPVPKVVETAPAVPPLPSSDLAAITARISEIKHSVNEKVGNPVNLIETHNEIGRTYMNALLGAMKKANGAPAGEVGEAMAVLERAYTTVMEAVGGTPLAKHTKPASVSAPIAQKVETAIFPPEKEDPVVEKEKIDALEARLALLKKKVSETVPVASTQRAEVKAASIFHPGVEVSSPILRKDIATPRKPMLADVPSVSATAPEVVPNDVPKEPLVPEQQFAAPKIPKIEVAPARTELHSVAKNKQLQDLLRANREKEVLAQEATEKEAIAKMDPLMTPEVTAGLSQLLSEWSLFRSSGFFGTGPSGKDHSLYLKLAPLTMATVIAGRFEGVTPLIKQSIADYMNGWRYEEGIIHEHGETFEHYLRKVVHHIVEKKKKALVP